jgi:hypothetical protein
MSTQPATTSHPRSEHASLADYVCAVLSPEQRQNVLLTSFSHWDFAQAALADTALCLRDTGSQVTLAFWVGETPLHDVGWTTHRVVSRIFRSPARDDRVKEALIRSGVPESDFARPPIRKWSPVEQLPIPERLNRSSIRAMVYRGSPMGRAILQVHPDRNTPISDEYLWPRRWVEATARSYAYVYDQTLKLIDDRSVTAIVVYNGRFLHDGAAAAAAESRGLPVLNYDVGGSQSDFDLTINATHDWDALQERMLNMYNQWPESERDEIGSSWFLERVNHQDPANALFVEAQRKGALVELPDAERLVVFFSSSGDEIAELQLNWADFFGGQPQALQLLADECRKKPGYALVVRSHPHKRMKPAQDVVDWLKAVDDAAPDLHLDPYSEVDSYELMRKADVVVTYGSTTGVEAAFAGRPVIVMGPGAYSQLGCAQQVSSREELSNALENATGGAWEGAVAFGLMMKRRGFRYKHVKRTPDGHLSLAGVPLVESNKLTLDVSHLLNRFHNWRATSRRGDS